MTKPTKGEVKVVSARTRVSRVALKDRTTTRTVLDSKQAESAPSKQRKTRTRKVPEKNPLVASISRPTRQKSVRKDVSDLHTESLDSKIAIIERMAKRDGSVTGESQAAPVQSRKVFSRMTRFVPRPSFQVIESTVGTALLTPFKMQLDSARLASQVARVAGVGVMMIGGFLTLFNMHAFGAFNMFTGQHVAQVIAPCDPSTLCDSATQSSTDGTGTQTNNTNSDTTSVAVNTTPEADIGIDITTPELSGVVPIHVTVPNATRVDVIAQSKETGQSMPVGALIKATDTLWKGVWNTPQFEDGMYRLKAVITNKYGSYVKEETDEYTIHNVIESTTQSTTASTTDTVKSDTTTTSTVTATTTATTKSLITRVEIGMGQPLRGKTSLRTLVSGAQTVKHYTRNVNATEFMFLGASSLVSTGEWRYAFDTTRLSDGTYDIRTVAVFENGTSASFVNPAVVVAQEGSTAAAATTTQVAPAPAETILPTPLAPVIRLELTKPSPVSGTVDIFTHVSGASGVELYTIPQQSLTPRFLGTTVKQSDTAWRYRVDTTNMPNGTYTLFALVRHAYGETKSDPIYISIKNAIETPPPTEAVKTTLETMKAVGEETDKIVTTSVSMGFSDGTTTSTPPQQSLDSPTLEEARGELEEALGDTYTGPLSDALASYKQSLSLLMYAYARAQREGNSDDERAILDKVRVLQEELFRALPSESMTEDMRDRIAAYAESIAHDLRDRAERSEALIRERVGAAISADSDADMISDYDEVNLYKTNPLVADSDGDGFTDTAEIMGGYDPTDSTAQVPVRFESPREVGVTRDDVLSIVSLNTLTDTRDGADVPKAYISGKALPNSFVTLYIFSTPIVVSVRTDANGNWNYLFDKTLEDGSHQIYVGMTDNAGRIIAKSSPFSFVKTAEAFTPVDAARDAQVSVSPVEPALVTVHSLLAIGSIAIVAMGMLLILLGLHVRPKDMVPARIPEPV